MYKEGQVVYYEFEPCTIHKMEENRVSSIKFEWGIIGGYDFSNYIVPRSDRTDEIARFFFEIKESIKPFVRKRFNDINVHNYLVFKWLEVCNDSNKDFNLVKDKITHFRDQVLLIYNDLEKIEVQGVKLF